MQKGKLSVSLLFSPEVETLTDQFQLSSDYLHQTLEDQTDFESSPIDAANPGFASLLPALRRVRQGQLEPEVLEGYYAGLSQHLEDVRSKMEQIPIPEGFEAQAEQAFAATFVILEQMQGTLDCLHDYLASGDEQMLDEAIAVLSGVHQQMRDAVSQLG